MAFPKCLFYKTKEGCKFREKCSYAHHWVDEQSSKRSKKSGDKSAVAMLKNTRQLGCVSHDMEPPRSSSIFTEELKHIEANPMCSIHQSRIASNYHSGPKTIAWNIFAPPNFEDRSQEETKWQERCAREATWRLANKY